MGVKKSIMSVVAMGALMGLSGQAVMASTPTSYLPPTTSSPTSTGGTLVALGDSITAGYGLAPGQAFPSLMGAPSALGETVDNLAHSGYTSTNLLNQLSDPTVQSDLSQANVVTIDIGSNDLLGPALGDMLVNGGPVLTSANISALTADVAPFASNLAQIVAEVHADAPNAYIVLYNIYNPVPAAFTALNGQADALIQAMNRVINTVATAHGLTVADAYTNIGSNLSAYVAPETPYPFGVHPNVEGQKELAILGEAALTQEITAWQTEVNKLAGSLPEVPFAGLMPLIGFGALAIVMLVARSRYSARQR